MILVVAPNEFRLRHFLKTSPIGGPKIGVGVSAADEGAYQKIRGIQAQAIVFTDDDLQMPPALGYWLQCCFSNFFDVDEIVKFERLIAQHTRGGTRAIREYAKVYWESGRMAR